MGLRLSAVAAVGLSTFCGGVCVGITRCCPWIGHLDVATVDCHAPVHAAADRKLGAVVKYRNLVDVVTREESAGAIRELALPPSVVAFRQDGEGVARCHHPHHRVVVMLGGARQRHRLGAVPIFADAAPCSSWFAGHSQLAISCGWDLGVCGRILGFTRRIDRGLAFGSSRRRGVGSVVRAGDFFNFRDRVGRLRSLVPAVRCDFVLAAVGLLGALAALGGRVAAVLLGFAFSGHVGTLVCRRRCGTLLGLRVACSGAREVPLGTTRGHLLRFRLGVSRSDLGRLLARF
mmetsp:Transcript_25967/g.78097  ORF Transcript_25967/g.78097 Transcript_25967/m.78097 type:complete len:289 (-) Transcript_25967:653-1519(-)